VNEPKHTCPFIDRSIKELVDAWEDVRAKNIEIRDWGQYWAEEYGKLEDSSGSEIKDLNDEIKDLKNEIEELKDELSDYKKGISA
jgi:peptidoglycan hydrolase CwlO-like protein